MGADGLSTTLQLTASVLGFLSSLLLLWGALRAAPLQELVDRAEKTSTGGLGAAFAIAAKTRAQAELRDVKIIERKLLLGGVGLLTLSFLSSIASHFL